MDEQPNYEKLAEDLEQDLEDFFSLRATERAKKDHKESTGIGVPQQDKDKQWHDMSGCCMTGCAGCPWGYKLPEKGT